MENLTTASGLTEYEAYCAQIVDDKPTAANTEKFAILNGIKWFAVDGVLPMKHYFELRQRWKDEVLMALPVSLSDEDEEKALACTPSFDDLMAACKVRRETFRDVIARAARERGYKLPELAAKIGCNHSSLWRYLKGQINMRADKVEALLDILGLVPVAYEVAPQGDN